MLQVYKNEAVADIVLEQIQIRLQELNWYTMNYDTMALQSALFAGFAFQQLMEPPPEGTNVYVESIYVVLTTLSFGFQICSCMSCTFCCIFGKGLALRGPAGARSVHKSVENMRLQHKYVFAQFLSGIIGYLVSMMVKMWIYFRPRIAFTVSIPLIIFFALIALHTSDLVRRLGIPEDRVITGEIAALRPYENVGDLDIISVRRSNLAMHTGNRALRLSPRQAEQQLGRL